MDRKEYRYGPARVFKLGEEPVETLIDETTPEERLAMVWTLSRRMFEIQGKPLEPMRRDIVVTRRLSTDD
jgi:hypothetical protein